MVEFTIYLFLKQTGFILNIMLVWICRQHGCEQVIAPINAPYIILIRVRCKHNLTQQIGPPFRDTISCLLTDISCYSTTASIMSKLVRNCEGSRAFAAFQKVNCRLKYARSWWSNCRRAVRVATTRRHLANDLRYRTNLSHGRLLHRCSLIGS